MCEAEISFQTDFFDQTLELLFTGYPCVFTGQHLSMYLHRPTAIHVFPQTQRLSMYFHRPMAIHVFSQAQQLSIYFQRPIDYPCIFTGPIAVHVFWSKQFSPLLILNCWVLVLYLCICICIFLLNTQYHEVQLSCHLWCQIQNHRQESFFAVVSQGLTRLVLIM